MPKLIPNPNGINFNRTREYTAYADEVLMFGRSVRAIEEVTQSKEAVVSTG